MRVIVPVLLVLATVPRAGVALPNRFVEYLATGTLLLVEGVDLLGFDGASLLVAVHPSTNLEVTNVNPGTQVLARYQHSFYAASVRNRSDGAANAEWEFGAVPNGTLIAVNSFLAHTGDTFTIAGVCCHQLDGVRVSLPGFRLTFGSDFYSGEETPTPPTGSPGCRRFRLSRWEAP